MPMDDELKKSIIYFMFPKFPKYHFQSWHNTSKSLWLARFFFGKNFSCNIMDHFEFPKHLFAFRGWIVPRHTTGGWVQIILREVQIVKPLFCRMWLIGFCNFILITTSPPVIEMCEKKKKSGHRKTGTVWIQVPQDETKISSGLKLACLWYTCMFNDFVTFS